MQRYQLLNGAMQPAVNINTLKYLNICPTALMRTHEGSKIKRFPAGSSSYCTMLLNNFSYVFIVENVKIGNDIHFYEVSHIFVRTTNGFVSTDGGSLTAAQINHLKATMGPRPVVIDLEPSFAPYVITWMLLMLVVGRLSIKTNSLAHAMIVEMCVNCFRFHRISLDRQAFIAVITAATRQCMLILYPDYLHSIIWLAAFHYQPTPCLIVAGVCQADYVVMFIVHYAHYVGNLGYVMIPIALGYMHVYDWTAFMPSLTAVSVCCMALVLGWTPHQLAAMAAAAMNSTGGGLPSPPR